MIAPDHYILPPHATLSRHTGQLLAADGHLNRIPLSCGGGGGGGGEGGGGGGEGGGWCVFGVQWGVQASAVAYPGQ